MTEIRVISPYFNTTFQTRTEFTFWWVSTCKFYYVWSVLMAGHHYWTSCCDPRYDPECL